MKYNAGAVAVHHALFNVVAVRAGGAPLPALVGAVSAAYDRYALAYHERGVEPNAELTYYVDVRFLALALLLEVERAAFCDGSEVFFKLGAGHANAVVADGERAGGLVGRQAYLVIRAVHIHVSVRQ